jgi:hypothetical protein
VRASAAGGPPRRPAASAPAPTPAPRRNRGRIAAIVGAAVAGLALVVLLATTLLGGDDAPPANTTPVASPEPRTTRTTTTPGGRSPAAFDRGAISVAVLNGTTTAGLARSVADRVSGAGFDEGQVTNAADQARPSTVVEYDAGQRRAALEVARVVKAGNGAVQPMSEGTRVLAGGAQVVVTVGADQNPVDPGPTTTGTTP